MDDEFPSEELVDDSGYYRYGAFRALGFTIEQAMVLAASKADWHQAEKALSHGCTHDLAIEIFS